MSDERADRLNALVDFVHSRGGVGVTRREIAEHLGLKMTPYLLELIKQVIDAGWMVEHVENHRSFVRCRYLPARPANLPAPEDYGP